MDSMREARAAIPQFMGVRIKRREDPALITGQGKYVGDIALDNLVYVAILRSPYAHARILGIDASEAKAMPGVIEVLVGDDINAQLAQPLPLGVTMGEAYSEKRQPTRYPLSTNKVRHVGEPIAVVVAESP